MLPKCPLPMSVKLSENVWQNNKKRKLSYWTRTKRLPWWWSALFRGEQQQQQSSDITRYKKSETRKSRFTFSCRQTGRACMRNQFEACKNVGEPFTLPNSRTHTQRTIFVIKWNEKNLYAQLEWTFSLLLLLEMDRRIMNWYKLSNKSNGRRESRDCLEETVQKGPNGKLNKQQRFSTWRETSAAEELIANTLRPLFHKQSLITLVKPFSFSFNESDLSLDVS